LDEPLASLAPQERSDTLGQLLETLNSEQRTVIMASRQFELLEPLARRIWLLHQGKLVWDSDPQSLKAAVVEGRLPAEIAQTLGESHSQAQS